MNEMLREKGINPDTLRGVDSDRSYGESPVQRSSRLEQAKVDLARELAMLDECITEYQDKVVSLVEPGKGDSGERSLGHPEEAKDLLSEQTQWFNQQIRSVREMRFRMSRTTAALDLG